MRNLTMAIVIMGIFSLPNFAHAECAWWEWNCVEEPVYQERAPATDAQSLPSGEDQTWMSDYVPPESREIIPSPAPGWTCLDLKTRQNCSLISTSRDAESVCMPEPCAEGTVCVMPEDVKTTNIDAFSISPGEDSAAIILNAMQNNAQCLKYEPTGFCPTPTSTFGKLKVIKDPTAPNSDELSIGVYLACQAGTQCVMGECAVPGTVTCIDGDKTDYTAFLATKQMDASQYVAGSVKVIQADGSGVEEKDLCKLNIDGSAFPFLYEYVCASDGSLQQIGVPCDPQADGSGKCVQDAQGGRCVKIDPALDKDQDWIPDTKDNCVEVKNFTQIDSDGDGVGDVCDNCLQKANKDQLDADKDGIGEVCDNCPSKPNVDQWDVDQDGVGEVCDNCPMKANADQADEDKNGIGNACVALCSKQSGNFSDPSISADGRYVVFLSIGSAPNISLRDRVVGSTKLVSINGVGYDPSVSADGKYVAFQTQGNVFLREMSSDKIWQIDDKNVFAVSPSISSGGNYIAYIGSSATYTYSSAYVRDMKGSVTENIAPAYYKNDTGVNGNISVNADGRYVAFVSSIPPTGGMPPTMYDNTTHVYRLDRKEGVFKWVSVGIGAIAFGKDSEFPSISADGRYVAFESFANNLAPGDVNPFSDIFVRDLKMNKTKLVSVDTNGNVGNSSSFKLAISANGRYVAFESFANNLVPGDTNGELDIFVHDLETGKTEIVSVANNGAPANGKSIQPAISADGRYVAFASLSNNLVPGDANPGFDVFVRDRLLGFTEIVSVPENAVLSTDKSCQAVLPK